MSIILNHVNYIYDEDTAMAHAALIDVNLEIPKGQFIGLIGHTGSGKSTLIQHMNQLNFLLTALPKTEPEKPKRKIGFITPSEEDTGD